MKLHVDKYEQLNNDNMGCFFYKIKKKLKKRMKMSEAKEDERKASTSVSTAASPSVYCKSLSDWDLLFLKEQFVIFRAHTAETYAFGII